jgi:chaperonin GroEL (HSP60 family)
VEEYQKVVDAEWNILYDKLDRIAKSGAKVVLSKLPIGDVATQVRNCVCFKFCLHCPFYFHGY